MENKSDMDFKYELNFAEIANSFHDAIFVASGDGIVLFINKAYTRITGIEPQEIVGKSVYNLEGTLFENSVTPKVIKSGKAVNSIGRSLKNKREMLVSGHPIFNEDGSLEYVVVNDREMQDLIRIETELKETREKLKDVSKDKFKRELELEHLRKKLLDDSQIIGASDQIAQVLMTVDQLKDTDVNVLITGETGVGKEVISNELFRKSTRNHRPYLKINCAAMPEALIESELFGHEKGAFTGANQRKIGLLELADGGTVLLDEIGELPLTLQSKFLRAIQQKEFMRIGGREAIRSDIRIIAATNRDLKKMSDEGLFRKDLYYRLNVVPINIEPLRKRLDDIKPLATYFLDRFNRKYGKFLKMSPDAFSLLKAYEWPGNVRELENVIERLVVVSASNSIDSNEIAKVVAIENIEDYRFEPSLKAELDKVEKAMLSKALEGGRTTYEAAKLLGINQSSVVRKMKKHQLKG